MTKSATRHVAARSRRAAQRGDPVEGGGSEIIGPAGSDRQMLPPTVATLCTLNEPSSASQHCRASAAPRARGRRAGRQRASSASVQVAAMLRPSSVSVSGGQPKRVQVEQPAQPRLRLGEQPGAAAEPGVAVPPGGVRGGREVGDGVQVHARSYLPHASTLLIMP